MAPMPSTWDHVGDLGRMAQGLDDQLAVFGGKAG
jgi:hypothetical protein